MLHPARVTTLPHDPTLLPNVDIDESHVFGSPFGFLNVSRRRLAIGAAAVSLLSLTLQDLPASAATVQVEQIRGSLQSLTTGTALPPIEERSPFLVTEYEVVQWPIDPGTAMAAGFGPRDAPCATCSSYHLGVDWNPPAGTPIGAIADGTVVGVNSISGDLGVHVVIEHEVDGQRVRSIYAHMQTGSSPLATGQAVDSGQLVGRVGNTGLSTGTHLHFAMTDADGGFFDPVAWMHAHVTDS